VSKNPMPNCRIVDNTPKGIGCVLLAGLLLSLAAGCSGLSARNRNAEGVQLFQQARYQEALRQFQEATFTDPNNPDGYYNLAATHHRIGIVQQDAEQLERAERYYHMCLDRNDNHRDCHRGLAVLLVEQGRKDDAFRLLKGWAESQPALADAKIELARLSEEFGDKTAAKEHLQEALKNAPDNPRALAALGKIREGMGEHAQALADYQRAQLRGGHQPQVAARISALRSTIAPPASISLPETPRPQTRMVGRGPAPLR